MINYLKDMPAILRKSFSISSNYFLDYLPFTIALMLFRDLNNSFDQAIVALTFSFTNFLLGNFVGLQDVIGIRGSQIIGQKNYEQFWQNFSNYMIIDLIFLTIFIILFYNIRPILILFNVSKIFVEHIPYFAKCLIIPKIIDNFANVMKGLLIAQNIMFPFFYINAINLTIYSIVSYTTILHFKLGLFGFLIAFYLKVSLEFILLLYCVVKYNKIKKPVFSFAFKNFKYDLHYFLYIVLAFYGEYFAFEVQAYYTAITGNITYVNSWQFYITTFGYLFFISQGILSLFRTESCYAIGQKDLKLFKSIQYKFAINGFCILIFLSSLLFVFSNQIATLFTLNNEIKQQTSQLIKLIVLFTPVDFFSQYFNLLMKIIHKENISFYVGVFVWPFFVAIFGYLYFLKMDYGLIGLAVGWSNGQLFGLIFLLFFYKNGLKQFKEHIELKKLNYEDEEISLILQDPVH